MVEDIPGVKSPRASASACKTVSTRYTMKERKRKIIISGNKRVEGDGPGLSYPIALRLSPRASMRPRFPTAKDQNRSSVIIFHNLYASFYVLDPHQGLIPALLVGLKCPLIITLTERWPALPDSMTGYDHEVFVLFS